VWLACFGDAAQQFQRDAIYRSFNGGSARPAAARCVNFPWEGATRTTASAALVKMLVGLSPTSAVALVVTGA
jgi:hypothetical protein